jgi:membrane fusion protein (multidrug efflux system)
MLRSGSALLGVGWVVAAALPLAGCGKRGPEGAGGGMVVHIVAAPARSQPLEDTLALIGTLEANEAVEIQGELDGTVDAIAFEEGQPVRAGEPLIQFDAEKLRASLAEAEANLRLAAANRARYAALGATQAVSRQEVDQAVAAHEAGVATVELLRAQLADAHITAPFDGVVGERLVSPGQFVAKGTILTRVVDDDPMKAGFQVPERYFAQLGQDQPVTLRVAAYPGETFTGRVYFIDPRVDETTRTVLVKAMVPNPARRLRRGMLAHVTLVARIRDRAVVVPETALLQEGETVSVFVVDADQTAQPRLVTTGVRLAGVVEIVSGLSPGELVVVEGAQKLRPGAPVKVRSPDGAS